MITDNQFFNQQLQTLKKDLLDNYEFFDASEIQTQNSQLLFVEIDGEVRYPKFQFSSDGIVYPELQKVLSRVLNSSSHWHVCAWLTIERTVIIDRAVITDEQTQNLNSLKEIIEVGKKAYRQSTYITSTPIKLLQDRKNSLFQIFCEDLLNPDERIIPDKKVII